MIAFQSGRLDVEIGGMSHKVGPLRIPDGLHLWWGDRGVHIFWHSGFTPRITFDRLEK